MKQYDIKGMSCAACASRIEKAISGLDGIEQCSVNLLTNSMAIEGNASDDEIIRAVEKAGYGASIKGERNKKEKIADDDTKAIRNRLIISIVLLAFLMYISMGHMLGWPLPSFLHGGANALTFALTQFLLCLPIAYVNRKFYIVGFKSLLHGAPNMDTLIAIGSGSALAYGVLAMYQIGYGLGHGDMVRVSHYMMDLYFER